MVALRRKRIDKTSVPQIYHYQLNLSRHTLQPTVLLIEIKMHVVTTPSIPNFFVSIKKMLMLFCDTSHLAQRHLA